MLKFSINTFSRAVRIVKIEFRRLLRGRNSILGKKGPLIRYRELAGETGKQGKKSETPANKVIKSKRGFMI